MNEIFSILIRISLKIVPKGSIDDNSAVVKIMAWRHTGADTMLTQFIDAYMWHWGKWVKSTAKFQFDFINFKNLPTESQFTFHLYYDPECWYSMKEKQLTLVMESRSLTFIKNIENRNAIVVPIWCGFHGWWKYHLRHCCAVCNIMTLDMVIRWDINVKKHS